MKVFPHVLLRVGGGPFESFGQLCLDEAVEIAGRIHALKSDLSLLQNRLSEQLYGVVSGETDANIRAAFINIRRDIFNGRCLLPERLAFVRPHLPPEIDKNLEEYLHWQEEVDRLWQRGAIVYNRELDKTQQHFDDLIKEDNLQKGLILSSQNLLQNGIPRYLQRNPASLSKSDRKTEQSLIKYLARIYAKTSPFSTFTNLATGQVAPFKGSPFSNLLPVSLCQRAEVLSHIRLNNQLHKYLVDLMTQNRAIYRWFPLRPNPTLTLEGEQYIYLTNSDNVESFQRLPATPVLELFRVLTSAQQEGVVYEEVIQAILNNESIDAAYEEIANYMDQLIAFGFL
jgi:hypothetical protein